MPWVQADEHSRRNSREFPGDPVAILDFWAFT